MSAGDDNLVSLMHNAKSAGAVNTRVCGLNSAIVKLLNCLFYRCAFSVPHLSVYSQLRHNSYEAVKTNNAYRSNGVT